MLNFSKSKYCGLWQCPKIAWLQKYKPEEKRIDGGAEARMTAGNEVGDLAMGIFGDYVEVTSYKGDKIDLTKMITDTCAEMDKETPVKIVVNLLGKTLRILMLRIMNASKDSI